MPRHNKARKSASLKAQKMHLVMKSRRQSYESKGKVNNPSTSVVNMDNINQEQENEPVRIKSPSKLQDVYMSDVNSIDTDTVSIKIEVQDAESPENDLPSNLEHVEISHENPELTNISIKIENPDSESNADSSNRLDEYLLNTNNIIDAPRNFALEIKIRRLIIEKTILQRKNSFLTQQNKKLKNKVSSMKGALIMLKKKNHELQKRIVKLKKTKS